MVKDCVRSHFLSFLFVLCLLGIASFLFPGQAVSTVSIGEDFWQVELAETERERSLGLGFRDQLCAQCGMLFVFDAPGYHSFWMKGMRFPLDIIFIAGEEVVSVERGISPSDERIFRPSSPITSVLEVNALEAKRVVPGMKVSLSR